MIIVYCLCAFGVGWLSFWTIRALAQGNGMVAMANIIGLCLLAIAMHTLNKRGLVE